MNKDEFAGSVRYAGGKIEKGIGDVVGSRDWQVDGVVDQVAGGAQNLYGRARSAVEDVVDGVPALAAKLGDEVREARDQLSDAADRVVHDLRVSIVEAPLTWIACAALVAYGVAWLVHGKRD